MVPVEPTQTESVVTVGCGVCSTVTVTVLEPVQPLAVYSTVYVVVLVGETLTLGPVPMDVPFKSQL